MENGAIKDSQITATSSMSGYEPHRGRLNWGDEGERVVIRLELIDTFKSRLNTYHVKLVFNV